MSLVYMGTGYQKNVTLKHTSTINKCSPMGPGFYPVPIYSIYLYMRVNTNICPYIHTYIHTYIHLYIYMYTTICMYMCVDIETEAVYIYTHITDISINHSIYSIARRSRRV